MALKRQRHRIEGASDPKLSPDRWAVRQLSGFLSDYLEGITEQNLQVAVQWGKLRTCSFGEAQYHAVPEDMSTFCACLATFWVSRPSRLP